MRMRGRHVTTTRLPTLTLAILCASLCDPVCAIVPYYKDPRIHMLGDSPAHALVARFATTVIDVMAYDRKDVRQILLSRIPREFSVIDMCCGTGTSTRIRDLGIDTSEHMIREARWRRGKHGVFLVANAETFGDDDSYDVVTLCFALHEMPSSARVRVLANAHRVARRLVLILDISPKYAPSRVMLCGEPYLLDYKSFILQELALYETTVHSVVSDRLIIAEIRKTVQSDLKSISQLDDSSDILG